MITLFEDWKDSLEFRQMLYSRKYLDKFKWEDGWIYPEIGKIYKVIDINRPWYGDGYFQINDVYETPAMGGKCARGKGFFLSERENKSIEILFPLGSQGYSFHLANEDGIKIYNEKMDPEKFGI